MKRKLTFTALVAVPVLLLFAVGAEVALRFSAPRSDRQLRAVSIPGSPRSYGLQPDRRSIEKGVEVRINAAGFREKPYLQAKPPGVRRIVVLGDSFTFGDGVPFEQTYSKQLERKLHAAGRPCEVISFGVGGYNTTQELATLREVALAYEPDLVIVGYVLNDIEPVLPQDGSTDPTLPGRSRARRLHSWIRLHSLLYDRIVTALGERILRVGGYAARLARSYGEDSSGWEESRNALLQIAAEARRHHANTLVVVCPMMLDFRDYPLADVHATLTRFCAEHGVAALDLLPAFRGRNAAELRVPFDAHPNARANGIFADQILNRLQAAPELLGSGH